jgi:hypothetical protein
MDMLFGTQDRLMRSLQQDFERDLLTNLPYGERAIMLYDIRGLGKTTLFL